MNIDKTPVILEEIGPGKYRVIWTEFSYKFIDNHYLIFTQYDDFIRDFLEQRDNFWESSFRVLGVADTKKECFDKIYSLARKYCKELAERQDVDFIDKSSRARQSHLEVSTQK